MVLIGNGEIVETGGCETRTGAARKTKARWTLDVSRRAQARARNCGGLKRRPDIAAVVSASLTGELRLQIGQPDVIRPVLSIDHDRMRAAIVGAIDHNPLGAAIMGALAVLGALCSERGLRRRIRF